MASRNPRKRIGNRLLDSLPAEELDQLRRRWEVVTLGPAEEVCRQDAPLPYVLFPVSGIYSTVVRLEDGRVVEAATVGNEGMIFRFVFWHSVALAAIVGVIVMMYAYVFPHFVPHGLTFVK